MAERTRAALYLRTSRDDTGEELAIKRHREACLRIAAEWGWDVVAEYRDPNRTASDRRKDRPGYDQMAADYAAGKWDAWLC
jgi:site-specific DNA recombinase